MTTRSSVFLLQLILVTGIASAQNIGIGTTSPTRGKLEVVGVAGAGNTNAIFGSNVSGISLQQNWPTIGFNQYRDNTAGNGKYMSTGYAAIQYFDPGGGGMYFDMLGTGNAGQATVSGYRALAFRNDGHVGVRTDAGTSALTVGRSAATSALATIKLEGTVISSYFNHGPLENTFIRAGLNGSTVFVNDIQDGLISLGPPFNGRVAIGAQNPEVYPLFIYETVDGNNDNRGILLKSNVATGTTFTWELVNLSFNFGFNFNGDPKSQISGNTGSYFTVSDRRVKNNVEELPGVLDKVMHLHPKQYNLNWEKPGAEKTIGLIAQEVKEFFPSLVTMQKRSVKNPAYGGITDMHMIDYSGFGVIAIKAIQEQQTIIAAQQRENKELRNKIDVIEKRLERLEQSASKLFN